MMAVDSEHQIYSPPQRLAKDAHVSTLDKYATMYRESIDNPEQFWDKVTFL